MNEWKPISEAPIETFDKENWYSAHSKDMILWTGYSMHLGSYRYTKSGKGKWHGNHFRIINPTHFIEAPEPPK